MKSKELRSLLLKLNNHLIRNLDTATGLGIKRGHYEITIEHLLSSLLEDGQGDIPIILKHYTIDLGDVHRGFGEVADRHVIEQVHQHIRRGERSKGSEDRG